MRETVVVMRRELKSYFLSPIAYVFGLLFLGVQLFHAGQPSLVQGGQASMQTFFSWLPWVFLFFLPALTMRTWAEERKLGTLELLMTFPVRLSQLIAGKFLAALAYLAVVLVFTLGLPLTLGMYGRLDWGPVAGAYLAAMLMAAAYLSVGMFWSSTCRDQIIALLLTLTSLLALYYLGAPRVLEFLADGLPTMLIDAIGAVSPHRYFDSIARGVIDTRDLVYYACFCGFFLHLNGLVLNARRQRG